MNNVFKFNQIRNGFKLDKDLEFSMMQEEIKEFYDSKDLAEMLDARLDVDYVFNGSMMKHNYAGLNVDTELFTRYKEFCTVADAILKQEFEEDLQKWEKCSNIAWAIVCDCNALKVAELDENGKVVKQVGLPNATDKIREMLVAHEAMDA